MIRAGIATQISIRGNGLDGARGLVFKQKAVNATVDGAASEELLRVNLTATGTGTHNFRVIAARGITNELALNVVAERTVDEAATKAPLGEFPIVVAGKLAERGEVDSIWIEAKAGETLTLTCAPGTSAFDPALAVLEPSGSWFDEGRLNQIAFNDEPLHFPGLSHDARLVHRFERAGKYAVQVRAFGGQGGADYTYQLRIERGTGPMPSLHPTATGWEERQFTRNTAGDWLAQLAARGGRSGDAVRPETFRATADESAEPPVMTAPGVVEGRITKPAETHRIRLRIDSPKDLAIEVQTPEATMPRFNPVIRLIAPGGGEVVTNVYTKRNNNGLYMMKMIQAKSTFTLRAAGDYLMEVRDITTDVAGPDFAYRVLVRPQIPHVGKAEIAEDHVNLEPGQAKPLTVNLDREEEFKGLILLSAEGLPAGVTATAGMANPVEKPPLPNGGRLERYVAKPQTATLMLSAAEDAPPSELPATVRLYFRTVTNGKQSPAILIKEIPVLIIPRRAS